MAYAGLLGSAREVAGRASPSLLDGGFSSVEPPTPTPWPPTRHIVESRVCGVESEPRARWVSIAASEAVAATAWWAWDRRRGVAARREGEGHT